MSVYGNEGAEVDPASAERSLITRLHRVLGEVPVGTLDLVHVLVGPDMAAWTRAALDARHAAALALLNDADTCVDPWAHEDGRCDQSCRRDAQ